MKLQSSFALSLLLAIGLAAATSLRAQVGNNNPTGPAGSFNGAVTTGGSYDPFTGNATRSITDIVVPGAVGEYPLAFTRTSNSRDTSWDFGSAGAWRHSYNWQMEDALAHTGPNFAPNYYGVTFPDGRFIYFTQSGTDPYFRGPPGVKERFQPLNTTTLLAYLILPDGGKVEFKATRIPPECDEELIPPCTYGYSFKAEAIIDPYGLRTLLNYNGDGTLNTIVEPAGRWLQIVYTTTPWTNGYGFQDLVIDHVTSSDGRSVQYNYGLQTFTPATIAFTYLGNVVYYGDSSILASYSYQAPNMAPFNGPPLLSVANDPMYAGPMKNISYTYATGLNGDNSTPVVGQIRYEKSADGQTVSNLGVIVSGRVETKGDGSSRYFTFPANGYLLASWSDFVNLRYANKQYDTNNFIQAFTDRNANTTNFVSDPITGKVTLVTYPLTSSDVALSKPRATVQYVYGSPSCPDPNNQLPYYLYSSTDERNNTTIYLRDVNHRIAQINYPNGGVETFTYNNFGQVATHRLSTGGLETFSYDTRGLLTQYRDAYHLATVDPQNPTVPANATPSLSYTYYTSGPSFDRVQTITDANNKVTTHDQYNSRGQLLRKTNPLGQGESTPSNVQTNYNTDGTLQWSQNELGYRTSYTYDDYKRITSITLPPRATGSPSPAPTSMCYDHTGGTSATDYTHTDANAWRLTLPSQKVTKTIYDSNTLKTSVTVGYGTADAATTTHTYDYNGNQKTTKDPKGQTTGLYTQYFYDTRNRMTDMDDPMVNDATTPHRNTNGHTVSWILDQASNKVNQRNANNQVTTFDSYDPMNRLLQQTVAQSPNPAAVTTYTYFPSGLLQFRKDPILVGGSYAYGYTYDLMGRTTRMAYPPDSGGNLRSEWISYDPAGNVLTYTNRAGNIQTFTYDGRNRQTGFTWNDGTTSWQAMAYDPASRVTQISNADAVINNIYFNDSLLKSQEEWATADAGNHRTVTFDYNADGARSNITYPSGMSFTHDYNGRNELTSVVDSAVGMNYAYYIRDLNGNVSTRYAGHHWAVTDASQRDPMGQVKHLEHQFVGTTRTFDYSYDAMGNRTSIQRDGGTAESYSYDEAQQVRTGLESGNVSTYGYDANGNRTSLNGGGSYTTNSLNQQTTFNGHAVSYDPKGNVATYAGSTSYVYDAQNRLKNVTLDGVVTSFKYDGLNRKISQTTGVFTTYNVWDDWNLIEERGAANALINSYVYGAGEIVERLSNGAWHIYFQDALGSTSHVSDLPRNLLESYKYLSTFGSVSVYSPAVTIRKSGSNYDVRHLFTGQLWMPQVGLYDYRNRVYSPGLARFLQPDPIGFAGDPSHLYRYCGNNPVNQTDPFGLTVVYGRGSDRGAINHAINYLNNSPIFANMFASLQNSSHVYTISTNYSFQNGSFSYMSGGILWNPSLGLSVTSGEGIMSAAMVLAHELAHAFHYDSDPQGYLSARAFEMPNYDNMVEYIAVTLETLIARELAEATRTDHRGEGVHMNSPTDSVNPGLSRHLYGHSPAFASFYLNGMLSFGPGWGTGSGLNPGSFGGASTRSGSSDPFDDVIWHSGRRTAAWRRFPPSPIASPLKMRRLRMLRWLLLMTFTTLAAAAYGEAGEACARLSKAGGFSLGVDVATGTMISGDRAFAEVLRRADRLRCFTEIMATGTNEAQMYALAALREVSPAQYKFEAKRLKARRFNVITLATEQQGILQTEPGETVITRIDGGMYQRTVQFWLKHDVPSEEAGKEMAPKQLEMLKARLRASGKGQITNCRPEESASAVKRRPLLRH